MEEEKSQLKKGVILNYINIGLGNLIPIFYTPVMLQLLGQSEYGLYKLSSSVTSYLSLVSLGIGSAVTRYLIKYKVEGSKKDEEKILGLFMIIFQIIAMATLLIGTFLIFNLHIWYGKSLTSSQLMRMKILVALMVCNMAISFSVSPYISVVNAHEKFVFLQYMNILSTCIAPIANLVMLYMGYKSIGMAISTLVINVIVQLLYLIYVRKKLRIHARYRKLPLELLKEILVFSFWIFLANVVSQLYSATDTVMIGAIPALATVGTAIYNVGNTLNSIVFTMTTGISNVLSPKTNRMVFAGANKNELLKFAISIGRIQAYIISLIVTGFIAFGQPFIYFYAGSKYSDAYWVAIFMMVPNLIPLVQSVCLNIIVAENRHRFRSIVYLGIAILNVIGTWVLMQSMGIIGAALMTGIALIIGQGFVMNWYYWKVIKLDIIGFWKNIIRISIAPVIMVVVGTVALQVITVKNLWMVLILGVMYVVLFGIASWILEMNDYEKSLVTGMFHKIKR